MFSLCLISTTIIIFIVVCLTLLKSNYLIIKILFVLNYFIYIVSYLYTILINPGIPERIYYIEYLKNKKLDDKSNWLKCSQCNILIPKSLKVTHCNICQVCIREHDHHCPWTGKCIGKYNLKSFCIFVNSLMSFLIMIFISLYGYMYYNSLKNMKK